MWKSPSYSTAARMRQLMRVCPSRSALHTDQRVTSPSPVTPRNKGLDLLFNHPQQRTKSVRCVNSQRVVQHHVEGISVARRSAQSGHTTKMGTNQPNQGCLHDTCCVREKKTNTDGNVRIFTISTLKNHILINTFVNKHVLPKIYLSGHQTNQKHSPKWTELKFNQI